MSVHFVEIYLTVVTVAVAPRVLLLEPQKNWEKLPVAQTLAIHGL